jgi:DNA-binding SARP family transcriptional activator
MLDGRAIRLPSASRRLVTLVALQRGPVRRARAAERLWPHLPSATALSSLRTALSLVRAVHPSILTTHADTIALHERVAVDLHEAETLARKLTARSPAGALDIPITLLAQPLMPDADDDWVVLERDRLQDLFLHALETHAARLAEEGCFALALATVHAVLATEPVRETAAQTLIEIHLAEGNRARALHTYREFHERLRCTLGIEPSAEMRALVEPLLTGRR